jgi:hypothetical protein
VVKVGLPKKQELDGESMGLMGELIGGCHGDLLWFSSDLMGFNGI